MSPRKPIGAYLSPTVVYLILIFGGILMILPLLWMITTALSNSIYATTFPPKFFPTVWDFGNYVRIFSSHGVGRALLNSVAIVIPAMIGQVIASSMGAYAFARLRARKKRVLFIIVLATLMIPAEVTIIPSFIIFKYLGWLNTLLPLIIPNFFGNAYNIFLMRQFFSTIPSELDEAARLDGLGFWGIYRHIILPLSRPVIATVALFTFTANWGSFLAPLIYINDPKWYPLAVKVYTLTLTSNVAQPTPWNLVMAGSMILTVPMILIYFFGQRQIYEGANLLGKIT
jgi:multiple sugar transport system permease protein